MTISRSVNISKDAESILTYLATTKSAMERHKRTIRDACHLTDTRRANRVFQELVEADLVDDDTGEGILDLTEAGVQAAQALQKTANAPVSKPILITSNTIGSVDGGSGASLVGAQDIFTTPVSFHQPMIPSPATGKLPSVPVKTKTGDDTGVFKTMDHTAPTLPGIKEHPLRNGEPEVRVPKGARPARSVASRFLLAFDRPTKNALPIPVLSGDVLGRSKKSTIILKHDDYVSNRHCAFEVQRDKATNRPLLFVEDLGSRNGTYIDDVEVYDGKAQAFHGSRIRVGDTVLVVVEIPF